jgi:two-component system sensor histidine kinase QseC
MKPPRSLQARLLGLVVGVVVLAWAATAAVTWVDVRDELDELLDAHLAQAAALLVAQQAGEPDDDAVVDAPTLHRYAPKVAFQVFHEGRLALRSAGAPTAPMTDAGGPFRSGYRTVRLDGIAWRMFATQGAERDVQVYVGERLDSRRDIVSAMLEGLLRPLALAVPLLALAAWGAIHVSLRPLRRLGSAVAARRPQALDPVVLADAPSEVRPVVDALNGLFGRIAELLEAERRFTADAAHELRTPIAAIRAQAQVAWGESDETERRHALQATLQGCDRASRLVDQMLTLARLEARPAALAQRVDLAALARRVADELAPRAADKRQALEVRATRPTVVSGDETLLAVLVRNLVDNAVRYSPAQARVRVTVSSGADGSARLSVEDSGPGLSPAHREQLGARFFRVEGSGETGSGLGWSIVRRIAEAHGLQVDVGTSADRGGLAVHVAARAPQER